MNHETFDKLEEWGKTRSIATATEICDALLADMQAKAIDAYAEPTIYVDQGARLRNKKTGEIGKLHYEPDKEYHFTVVPEDPADMAIYRTLAELNEEWEDYKPKEPVIEDEKARKAFQEWAGLFDTERFRVVHFQNSKGPTTLLRSTDLTIEPSIELPGRIGEESEIYTRSELIGEEEK